MNSELETKMDAEEFLNSIDEWDIIFDPEGKQEYTEAQLIRFAEMWAKLKIEELKQ